MLNVNRRQRISPVESRHAGAQGREQIVPLVQVVMKQMRNDFSIRCGDEFIAGGGQFFAQHRVIFNNAVVHDGEALARDMRVGIRRRGLTVRGPARMGDAGATEDGVE